MANLPNVTLECDAAWHFTDDALTGEAMESEVRPAGPAGAAPSRREVWLQVIRSQAAPASSGGFKVCGRARDGGGAAIVHFSVAGCTTPLGVRGEELDPTSEHFLAIHSRGPHATTCVLWRDIQYIEFVWDAEPAASPAA